jgi:hypothetical protein
MIKQATPAIAAKLQGLATPLAAKLKENPEKFKAMLPAKLSANYNICYWSDDGCYYCSDDGTTWVAVECIT